MATFFSNIYFCILFRIFFEIKDRAFHTYPHVWFNSQDLDRWTSVNFDGVGGATWFVVSIIKSKMKVASQVRPHTATSGNRSPVILKSYERTQTKVCCSKLILALLFIDPFLKKCHAFTATHSTKNRTKFTASLIRSPIAEGFRANNENKFSLISIRSKMRHSSRAGVEYSWSYRRVIVKTFEGFGSKFCHASSKRLRSEQQSFEKSGHV